MVVHVPPVARPPGHPAILLTLVVPALASLWLLAAILSGPVQDIAERHRIAQWPEVTATISSSRIDFRQARARSKRRGWNAWCTSWDYDYAWQGTHHGGSMADDTVTPYPPGCFGNEDAAHAAAARRPGGSTVTIHVDPADPMQSTAQPTRIPASEIGKIGLGLLPMTMTLWLLAKGVRRFRQRGREDGR